MINLIKFILILVKIQMHIFLLDKIIFQSNIPQI